MSTQIVPLSKDIEQVLICGDISKLSVDQRLSFYNATCASLGLNPLTKPFQYITLNNKMVLYATKDCTEQLRSTRTVSVKIVGREVVEGCYVVTAQASLPTGRCDESIGAVPIENLKGEARSNAMMKCETKAKRRVTLSICGLGMLDESEVDSIPGASTGSVEAAQAVAASKIKAMPQPKQIEAVHFVEPELRGAGAILPEMPEARHAQQQAEAAAAIADTKGPTPIRKKGDISYKALGDIGKLKVLLRELTSTDGLYYETLQAFGISHADELSQDEGRKLWKTLKEMTVRLGAEKNAAKFDMQRRDEITKQLARVGNDKFIEVLGACSFESLSDMLKRATPEEEEQVLQELKHLS